MIFSFLVVVLNNKRIKLCNFVTQFLLTFQNGLCIDIAFLDISNVYKSHHSKIGIVQMYGKQFI